MLAKIIKLMKNLSLLIFFILFPTLCCLAQNEPIQIVLLGTYHLSGSTPDPIKVSGDTILGTKRQKEIQEIVTQLAKFKPQHIFIEKTEKWDSVFQNVYQKYQQGIQPERNWILTSEMFQFGIKTAHKVGLKHGVTLVDWQLPDILDTTEVLKDPVRIAYKQYLTTLVEAAKERGFSVKRTATKAFNELIESHIEFMNKAPSQPLKESLLTLNSEENRRQNYYFSVLHFMDKDLEEIGVDWTQMQNIRNMYIYRNILKHITEDTKRCLVIYGASHIQALRDFFESNPRFEIVEVSEVLK